MTQARPSEKFRQEHRELMEHIRHLGAIMDGLRAAPEGHQADLEAVQGFFEHALKPHAQWEEDNLYPVIAPLLSEHGNPTATMIVDHAYLVALIDEFTAAVRALRDSPADERANKADAVRRVGYQIQALLDLHFRKEENVYLSLADSYMTQAEFEDLLKTAAGIPGHSH